MGQATFAGVPLSLISLVTLTVQNSALTIVLHYVRLVSSPFEARLRGVELIRRRSRRAGSRCPRTGCTAQQAQSCSMSS